MIGAAGIPPASWRQAAKPTSTAFSSERDGRRKLARWLLDWTGVSGIQVLDETLVLVSHGRHVISESSTTPEMFQLHSYAVDVYSRSGRKLHEDLGLTGEMVHADSLLYVVRRSGGKWYVDLFRSRMEAAAEQKAIVLGKLQHNEDGETGVLCVGDRGDT